MVFGIETEVTGAIARALNTIVPNVTNLSTQHDVFMYGFSDSGEVMYIAKKARFTYDIMLKQGAQGVSAIYPQSDAAFVNAKLEDYDNVAFISTDSNNPFNQHGVALIVPGAHVNKLSSSVLTLLLGERYLYLDSESLTENGNESYAELLVPTNAVGSNRRTPVLWITHEVPEGKVEFFGEEPQLYRLKEVYPAVEDKESSERFVPVEIFKDGVEICSAMYNRNNKGFQGTIPEDAIMRPIRVLSSGIPTDDKKSVQTVAPEGFAIPTPNKGNVEIPEVGKKSAAAALLGGFRK